MTQSAGGASQATLGVTKKLGCTKSDNTWQCRYDGFGESVTDFIAKRLVLRPDSFGNMTPPADAKDDFGRPMAKSSKLSKVILKSGPTVASEYRADQPTLKAMLDYLPDTEEASFKDHLADVGYHAPCKPAELYALMDYSQEGYKDTNSSLRKLYADPAAPIDAVVDTRTRVTVSGVNCAKKISTGVVVRGATLTPDKLARYQPGAFVIEPAFTSTSVGEQVHSSFEGNVEFQIFDGKGANLTQLSLLNEEGEQELLFQAGSIFKVLSKEQDDNVTVIKMAYVP